MSQPSPLSVPGPWDLVASAYLADVVPTFEPFADQALALAAASPGHHVVDVACGPGTLALRAARRGIRVSALDFSERMIDGLRDRIVSDPPGSEVRPVVGDGQQLPFEDASFDAGFSLFGLMFFPDRARGFVELRRVVRPGGRVVVSSWPPAETTPWVATLFEALDGELTRRAPAAASAPRRRMPLVDPADYHAEMGAAGFTDIVVTSVDSRVESPSTAELWAGMQRSNAALLGARRAFGAAWDEVAGVVLGALEARFGAGPQVMVMPAWMAVATA